MMRVVVGSDIAGLDYKTLIVTELATLETVDEIIDVGTRPGEDRDYPHVGVRAARLVASGRADRGILICGTGIGMALAANTVPGVRACTAHDSYSVERLVLSNNAHILCLGQRVLGSELAKRLAREFLAYVFDDMSNSSRKVKLLAQYGEMNRRHVPNAC